MIDLLGDIWHGILSLPYVLIGLLITSINGWILILAGIFAAAMALLPGFPSVPTLDGDVISGVAWFLPIGAMLAIFATFVSAFIIWLAVQIGLRWVKAL